MPNLKDDGTAVQPLQPGLAVDLHGHRTVQRAARAACVRQHLQAHLLHLREARGAREMGHDASEVGAAAERDNLYQTVCHRHVVAAVDRGITVSARAGRRSERYIEERRHA